MIIGASMEDSGVTMGHGRNQTIIGAATILLNIINGINSSPGSSIKGIRHGDGDSKASGDTKDNGRSLADNGGVLQGRPNGTEDKIRGTEAKWDICKDRKNKMGWCGPRFIWSAGAFFIDRILKENRTILRLEGICSTKCEHFMYNLKYNKFSVIKRGKSFGNIY
ncbi:hypothetical protein DFR59_105176 [Falsibacillus pallidus]|uniref:Uncharacterized protein n=1 Tax=Falsibacillus pallidus TaxID=493781 RepID=A0A370GEV3_9BACI|nr:hypothetical protein DFR59_105176 [Falsibacillus pallidus]